MSLNNTSLDSDIFKDRTDYWMVADNIKALYMSSGSMQSLLDFERVLDEMDVYAFKNWAIGELVSGPDIKRYSVTCIFMWPAELMPDPSAAKRLTQYDCQVRFKKTVMQVPIKIHGPDDFAPGTKKAKLIKKKIWLVEITIPKALMSDIRTGSVELEDQTIDLGDLDRAYEQDLDRDEFKQTTDQTPQTMGGQLGF